MSTIQPGMRVAYTGDVCNGPREGVVDGTYRNRWGAFALIRWDTDQMIGWERDGTPVTCQGDFFQEVAIHTIEPAPKAGARFHLLPKENRA